MEKIVVRTSDRLAFKACRRKWDLGSKIRQNYEPLISPKPLEFGIAIHAALQEYYDPKTWDDSTLKETAALGRYYKECEAQKQKYFTLTDRVDLDFDIETEMKERLELGVGMLRGYFKWAPAMNKNMRPVYTEIEFEVPVLGRPPDVVYQGRVDLLLQDEHGWYWIVDHKTAAQLASTEHLELDEQCGSYAWALQKMLGIKIAGVLYDELVKAVPHPPQVLKSGGLSKNKQQRTTYEMYVQTIDAMGLKRTDYEDFLEYLHDKPQQFFRRTPVARSQFELQQLGIQIAWEVTDMLNDPAIYPSPGRFNCMGCSYRNPCLALNDGSDVQYILDNYYRKRGAGD